MTVKVRYHRCRLNVCLHLPDTDHTFGILGTATNDVQDDWTTLDGTVLSIPESLADRLQKPAYDFCTQNFCLQDRHDSLFAYPEEGFDFDYYQKCGLPFGSTIDTYLNDVPQWMIDVCKGELQCIMDVKNGDEQDAMAMRNTLVEYGTMCNPSGGECDDSPCCSGECIDYGGFAGKICDGNLTCAPIFGNCEQTDCCEGLTCTEMSDGTAMCIDQRELMDEWMSCEIRDCEEGLVCLDNQRGGKQCRRLHQCSEKWDDCSMVTCCGNSEMKCLDNGFGGKHCVEIGDCYDREGMDCSDNPCCDGLTCVLDEGRSVCRKLPDYVGLGESCAYVLCREDYYLPLDCVDIVDDTGREAKQCQAPPAYVRIFVFNDLNANGIQDFGEPPVSNVTLELVGDDDQPFLSDLSESTTDNDGFALFSQVPRGVSLRVKVLTAPIGALRTLNNQGDNDLIDSDLLDDGISNPFIIKGEDTWTKTALGYRMPADLQICVFNDLNGNGLYDGDEVGIEGVKLHLITPGNDRGLPEQGNGGSAHEVLTSGEFGLVTFSKVPQNVEIRAQVTQAPLGAIATDSRAGGDDTTDSDLRSDGTSFSLKLKVGSTHTSLDLGYRMPQTLRVRIWNDANQNGVRDNGETGIEGVGVRLVDDKDRMYLMDHGGNSHQELVTDDKGISIFTKVPIGVRLRVMVTQPPKGAIHTVVNRVDGNESTSDLESDGFSGSFSIKQSGSEVDLGYLMPGSLTVRIWDDANSNRLQDNGEKGISHVTLRLIKDSDQQSLSVQDTEGGNAHLELTSNHDGFVTFNQVPRGIYLRVNVTNAPANVIRTIQNAGNNSKQNSNLGNDGLSDRFALFDDGAKEIDLGFLMPRDVKIRVWGDKNSNGIQDEGELGISGVKLRLVKDRDTSFYQGECEGENGNDEKVGQGNCREEVITDGDGYVVFKNVPKSTSFRVKVINAPYGLTRTVHNKGNDSTADSDLGNNGLTDAFHLGKFSDAVFTELDIGYIMPDSVQVRVWDDANGNGVQDLDELGVAGVKLRLIRASTNEFVTEEYGGNAHEELETNAIGIAHFVTVPTHENLRVKVTNSPSGAMSTNINSGSDEASDSDLRSDGTTVSFSLGSFGHQAFDKIDIGYRMPNDMRVRVWDDVDGDGLQNAGERGIYGVKLRLINNKGDFLSNIGGGSDAHLEHVTDFEGFVTFHKVPKGVDVRVMVTNAPPGSIRTVQNRGGDEQLDSDLGLDMISDIVNLNSFDGHNAYESLDLGLKMPKTMVIRVWNDLNRDGVQDVKEGGIPNVRLRLIEDLGRDNLPEQGNGGNAHEIVTTNILGLATFTKVPQGVRLRVKVVESPENGRVTKKKALSDNCLDSEMNPSGISDSFKLPNDATELFDTVDIGYYFPEGFGVYCF